MGFCYETDWRTGKRRLVCEACSAADGTVRKVACPGGWCQADALCVGCRKDPEVKARRAEAHAGCAAAKARYAAECAAVDAVLATGAHVFCASVYADSTHETVRCTFRAADGDTKDLVVSNTVRDTLTRTTTYAAALETATAEYEAGKRMAAERRAALAAFDAEYGVTFGEVR